MRNKKIYLWIVGAFAVLLGIYLWATLYSPNEKKEQQQKETYKIFNTDVLDILSVSIKNQNGSFEIYKKDNCFYVKNNDNIILDYSAAESLYMNISNIASSQIVDENPINLSSYGLTSPMSEIKVLLKDGEKNFLLGNKISENGGYYFKDSDNATIYVLSEQKGSMLCLGLNDFRNMTVSNVAINEITKIEINSPDKVLIISRNPKYESEESTVSEWIIPSFMNKAADTEALTNYILNPLSALVASSVAEDSPSDLSKYNLNTKVTIYTAESDYSFSCGQKDNKYYARINSLPSVYTLGSDSVGFLKVNLIDIVEKYAYLIYLDDISSVNLSLPSGKYNMEIKRNGNEELFYINGKKVSADRFKAAYQQIVAISIDDITFDTPQGNAVASIDFGFNDNTHKKLAFYEYDNLNYLLTENGNPLFCLKKQIIAEIEKALSK